MDEPFYKLGKLTEKLTLKHYDFTPKKRNKIVGSIVAASKVLEIKDRCSIIDFRQGYLDGMFEEKRMNEMEKTKHEHILYSTTEALKVINNIESEKRQQNDLLNLVIKTESEEAQKETEKTPSYLGPEVESFD